MAQPGLVPDIQQLAWRFSKKAGSNGIPAKRPTGPLSFSLLAQTCPINLSLSLPNRAAFPTHPVRSTRGLMQTSWSLSIFPECICFSRRQHCSRCLKAHLGSPVGRLRLPHTRKLVSHFLIASPPHACLTEQCWLSYVSLSLLTGSHL